MRKPKQTRAEIAARKQRFVEMCAAGFSREQIAAELDIGRDSVRDRALKLRAGGLDIPVPHVTHVPNRTRCRGLSKRSVPGHGSLVKW